LTPVLTNRKTHRIRDPQAGNIPSRSYRLCHHPPNLRTVSLLSPDGIGAPRQTSPAVVQRTAFAQRHRSRRVSSPHASGLFECASVAVSPGNRRQSRAQPFTTRPASRAKAGNATVIGGTSSRCMAPDRENSMPCWAHRHGMRFKHRYESIKSMLLNASREQPAGASAAAGRSDRAVHSVGHWWCGWQLTDDARQAGSHSVAGQGIDTRRSVDASFHMGSGYSPGDGTIIALAGRTNRSAPQLPGRSAPDCRGRCGAAPCS
jgi:hypothetical protein